MASPLIIVLALLGLYYLVFGLIVFYWPPRGKPGQARSPEPSFRSETTGPDRGILIDNPYQAGLARLKIIEEARESLDVAYFSIESGNSPRLFFGALLEAADRGVQVNILLDGIFHGIKGSFRSILYSCLLHPRMKLKFYEPPNPLLPWTFNNRMHDKVIMADGHLAILGGRNIGDKYFNPDWYQKKVSHDRDVIIMSQTPDDPDSVLPQLSSYFKTIWNHKYSRSPDRLLLLIRRIMAWVTSRQLKQILARAREAYPQDHQPSLDLEAMTFPTRKVTLISNPLERFSKRPRVWTQLTDLMKSARQTVFIQSPYVIPSRAMRKSLPDKATKGSLHLSLLTNSLASTPNWLAFSGYLNHRKGLVKRGMAVYEYQSDDSLHTKAVVIDQDLLALGSFNVDHRSAFLSTELMLVIHSPEAVEKLNQGLSPYVDQSLRLGSNDRYLPHDQVSKAKVPAYKRLGVRILQPLAALIEPFL